MKMYFQFDRIVHMMKINPQTNNQNKINLFLPNYISLKSFSLDLTGNTHIREVRWSQNAVSLQLYISEKREKEIEKIKQREVQHQYYYWR